MWAPLFSLCHQLETLQSKKEAELGFPAPQLFCGSQDTAEYLTAMDICAEVLMCLERRKVSWLMLFQLTETGEKPLVPACVWEGWLYPR